MKTLTPKLKAIAIQHSDDIAEMRTGGEVTASLYNALCEYYTNEGLIPRDQLTNRMLTAEWVINTFKTDYGWDYISDMK